MSSVNLYYGTSIHDDFNIQIAGKEHKKVLVLNENNKRVYKLPHREVVVRIAWNSTNGFETEDKLGVIRRFCLETGETTVVFKPDSLLSKEDRKINPAYRKIDPFDRVQPIVIPPKEIKKSESLLQFKARVMTHSDELNDITRSALPILSINGFILSQRLQNSASRVGVK